MSDAQLNQTKRGPGCLEDGLPDLGPLRALAETQELADAEAGLTDCYRHPPPSGDQLYPLAQGISRALTEAGFTLHYGAQHDPLFRQGSVCVCCPSEATSRTAAESWCHGRP